jgi:hypothetical protein
LYPPGGHSEKATGDRPGVFLAPRTPPPTTPVYDPMTKRELIDDIRQYNSTAQPQFLAQFDEDALKQYLEHLEQAREKHLRHAAYVPKGPKLRMVS